MRPTLVMGLLFLAGCLPFSLKPDDPIRPKGAPPIPKLAPASLEAASRVDAVGRELFEANKDLPFEPHFLTIGVKDVSVFHRGNNELYVSDGMVKRCQTDEQLAAVLAFQLGRMVAEQDQLEMAKARNQRPLPSGTPRDVTGASFNPDQVEIAELARFERENPRRGVQTPSLEPRLLAAEYLRRAKHSDPDVSLRSVEPFLAEAEKNHHIERQMTGR